MLVQIGVMLCTFLCTIGTKYAIWKPNCASLDSFKSPQWFTADFCTSATSHLCCVPLFTKTDEHIDIASATHHKYVYMYVLAV